MYNLYVRSSIIVPRARPLGWNHHQGLPSNRLGAGRGSVHFRG